MTSASTWPEPTKGKLVDVAHERLRQQDIAMEVSNKGTLNAVTVSANCCSRRAPRFAAPERR